MRRPRENSYSLPLAEGARSSFFNLVRHGEQFESQRQKLSGVARLSNVLSRLAPLDFPSQPCRRVSTPCGHSPRFVSNPRRNRGYFRCLLDRFRDPREPRGIMARPLRLEYPGALWHITARGNNKCAIFHDDEDRLHFLALLEEVVELCNWRLHRVPEEREVA
jgi:hypothetical protein